MGLKEKITSALPFVGGKADTYYIEVLLTKNDPLLSKLDASGPGWHEIATTQKKYKFDNPELDSLKNDYAGHKIRLIGRTSKGTYTKAIWSKFIDKKGSNIHMLDKKSSSSSKSTRDKLKRRVPQPGYRRQRSGTSQMKKMGQQFQNVMANFGSMFENVAKGMQGFRKVVRQSVTPMTQTQGNNSQTPENLPPPEFKGQLPAWLHPGVQDQVNSMISENARTLRNVFLGESAKKQGVVGSILGMGGGSSESSESGGGSAASSGGGSSGAGLPVPMGTSSKQETKETTKQEEGG